MNKLALYFTLMATMLPAQSSAVPVQTKIYFLESSLKHQWCGYSNESRLKEQIKTLRAFVVGTGEYKNRHLFQILVTETDETGDWAINDNYAVGVNGVFTSLKRAINVLPDSIRDEQLFMIRNGKAVKQRGIRSDLRTGKIISGRSDLFALPNVMVNIGGFPFARLLTELQQTNWASGEACFSSRL